MESNLGESVTPELSTSEHSFLLHKPRIYAYVQNKPVSTNTKLFSVLALLNAHDPESKLDVQDCQQILGPPDPSHGEPPFEKRMEPFSCFITVSSQAVHVINTDVAKSCLELLAELNISKNAIVKDCIELLCGDKVQPHTVSTLRNVLTGSNVVENSKDVSLRLTKEIMEKESMALQTTTAESSSERTVTSNINLKSFLDFFFCLFKSDIFVYVENSPDSDNTKLFSILALLNAYVPKSYLLMQKYQQILNGSPLEEKMKPFLSLNTAQSQSVCMIHKDIANRSVEQLAALKISRSSIASNCMDSLCGDQDQHCIVKKLLIERKKSENGKRKFSTLIEDILNIEGSSEALHVLKQASQIFQDMFIYPQTIARLYYQHDINYEEAEEWAKKAISRDLKNSFVADTLGQVYKNWLKEKSTSPSDVNDMAKKAIKAFKNVEKKAKNECADETNLFNNRGHFGFIQVAKIVSEKHKRSKSYNPFRKKLKFEVRIRFEFFEWYLSYSNLGKPHKTTVEPDFFWRDVAICYQQYTAKNAADSTSFPALLDCLNHSLFVSKEKRAFKSGVTEKTRLQLEQTRDVLKTEYEENVDDVKVAERYILSNIILNNKEPHSPQHALVRELQAILKRLMLTVVNQRHPEFYLLVLLLFWPEEQLRDQTLEESNTGKESEQPSSGLSCDLDDCVTLMEKAYLEVYDKYLRGRYLLPLFFLGKGSGLSRWIHRSRLDAAVELMVEAELGNIPKRNGVKRKKINEMWKSWKAWQLPQIQELLQPLPLSVMTFKIQPKVVIDTVGGKKIQARTECKSGTPAKSPMIFYLGFDIRGPVVFKVPAAGGTFEGP